MRKFIYLSILLLSAASTVAAENFSIIPTETVQVTNEDLKTDTLTREFSYTALQKQSTHLLSDVLRSQANLQLYQFSENGQPTLSMAGFSPSNPIGNTVFSLDGISLQNIGGNPTGMNLFLPEDLSSLSIQEGSNGVEEGDGAVAGSIQLSTAAPTQDELNFQWNAGSYYQTLANIQLEQAFSNGYAYRIRAHRKINPGQRYRSAGRDTDSHFSIFRHYDSGYLSAQTWALQQVQELPGAIYNLSNTKAAQFIADFLDEDTRIYYLHWQQILSDHWYLKTQVLLQAIDGNERLANFPGSNTGDGWVFKPKLHYQTDYNQGIWTFDIGTETTHQTYSTSLFSPSATRQYTTALFAITQIPFTPKSQLILGGREAFLKGSVNSNTSVPIGMSVWVEQVGWVYQLTPRSTLSLRRDGNFRFPLSSEQVLGPTPGNLTTQKGGFYTFSYDFHATAWQINPVLYLLKLKNEIDFNPQGANNGQPLGQITNLPPTQRTGFTLNMMHPLFKNSTIEESFSIVDAHFSQGAYQRKQLPGVSTTSAVMTYHYQKPQAWNWQLSTRYDGPSYANNDYANQLPLQGSVTTLDTELSYPYASQGSLSLRINNLLNRRHNYYIGAVSDQLYYYPAPGRVFLFSFKFKVL